MKQLFSTLLFLSIFSTCLIAQNNVGIGTSTPNPSAKLDISDANKGLLINRVNLSATTDVTTIPSPATGLLVFNVASAGSGSTAVTANSFYYFDGTKWIKFQVSNVKNWTENGNAGTIAPTTTIGSTVNNNFIGTTDNVDLAFVTDSKERMRILESNGNIGIGTKTPSEKLDIDGNLKVVGFITNQAYGNVFTESLIAENLTGPNRMRATTIIGNQTTPDASAMLDVVATNKGLLVPRIALTSTKDFNTIPAAANSLLVFNTTTSVAPISTTDSALTEGYYYWIDAPTNRWTKLITQNDGWQTKGNNTTNPSTSPIGTPISTTENFIGTADAKDFVIATNNLERTRITSNGNVGIGVIAPAAKLDIAGNLRIATTASAATTDSILTINTTTGIVNKRSVSSLTNLQDLRLVGGSNHITQDAGVGGTGTSAGTGYSNIFMGITAGNSITNGSYNIGIGQSSLSKNSTGERNTAVGIDALFSNINGFGNSGLGFKVLQNNTRGASNTAVGYSALINDTSGSYNTALGLNAGYSISSGSTNTIIGKNAGGNITTGSNNLILGADIDAPSATANNQLSIGNIIYGTNVDGTGTTPSSGKVGIGINNPTAKLDIAGNLRIATTPSAATTDSILTINTTTGIVNKRTANSLQDLRLVGTGNHITQDAGNSNNGTSVGSGSFDIYIGQSSGLSNTSGYENVGIGEGSLYANTNGHSNIAIGSGSLLANTSGFKNTVLGIKAADNITTGAYNIIIGADIDAPSTTANNQLSIGNIIYGTNVNGTGTTASSGNVGIGINNPAAKLDIAGNLRIATTASAAATDSILTINTTTGIVNKRTIKSILDLADLRLIGTSNHITQDAGVGGTGTSVGTGTNDIFIGNGSGNANTTGSRNIFNGYQSGLNNTTGNSNIFNGSNAGNSNTTGNYNVAIGDSAGYKITTGNNNTTIGKYAGDNITTGSNNLMLGADIDAPSATANNQLSIGNIIYGTNVDGTGTTASSGNVGIGINNPAAKLDIAGNLRIATTASAAATDSILTINTTTGIVNKRSVSSLTNLQDLRLIGTSNHITQDAGVGGTGTSVGTGTNDIFIGNGSGFSNTTGADNTAIGSSTLTNNTTGQRNIAIGNGSLYSNKTGINNVAIGTSALSSNTTGSQNTAVGHNALLNDTSGTLNAAVGTEALYNTTRGSLNSAFGYRALYSNDTGRGNVGIGYLALNKSLVHFNTAVGFRSLVNTTIGNYNTAIGDSAGFDLTTGNNNIFVGRNTVANVGVTADNQLNIGNWIYGNNGRIGIGTTSTATNPTRAQLVVNGFVANNNGSYGYLSAGGAGTGGSGTVNTSIWASDRIVANEFNATSDMRIKRNIKPLENNSLAKLAKIQIVSYTKLSVNGSTNEIGVLGQEIEKILPDAVKTSEGDIYNDSTKTWEVVQDFRTVNYQSIGLLTTKAVQELNTQVQQQQAMIEALKKDNEELKVLLKKMIERK